MSRPSAKLRVGNTPLLRLCRVGGGLKGIEIYAKAEFLNPSGSVKDRAALAMIEDGERRGLLTPDRILLDASSGNTAIAYAMFGAARGYRVMICMPRNSSLERQRILRAHGAEVVLTDPAEGSDGAIRECRRIFQSDPERYFYPDQYNNPANWRAHFRTTGLEIVRQTRGRVTHFVAVLGTTGSFVGVSRRLRQEVPGVECWAVQPDSPFHGIEGAKHLASAIVPGIWDPSLANGTLWVETEQAYEMTRRLAREEGLLVGISSGANVAAALELGRRLQAEGRSAVIVTLLCDDGQRYLSERLWDAAS
ncbi:MAG: cysteine synthase family protein [Bryobacteraceae bacterium]|nr:cysteine synthase family protein [Bryobacteraceae bacterium]